MGIYVGAESGQEETAGAGAEVNIGVPIVGPGVDPSAVVVPAGIAEASLAGNFEVDRVGGKRHAATNISVGPRGVGIAQRAMAAVDFDKAWTVQGSRDHADDRATRSLGNGATAILSVSRSSECQQQGH